jgi:alpha-2-macroglobulin
MSRIPRRFFVLAILLVALNVGGLVWIRHELAQQGFDRAPDQPIHLVSSFPQSNADHAERLSLHFDQDVGDVTQLNKQLDQATPFKLSPVPDGDWIWSSPKQLDFVLNKPLPAGQSFEVKPAVGIKQQLGQVILVDNKVEFQTSALDLQTCRLVSSDHHDVTFELIFNQQVAVDEALQAITVWDRNQKSKDRNKLKVESLIQQPSKSLVLRCSRPNTDVLIISINENLKGHEATRSIGKRIERSLDVQPVMAFVRTNVRELGIDGQFDVDVYFTTGLAAKQDLPPIKITPSVDGLETSLNRNWRSPGRILRLRGAFEPGRRYQVKLPATLLSAAKNQKTLGEKAVISVDIPDRRPQVEFSDYRGILSPDGNLNLDLQTVNVNRLVVKASRVHANNLVAHLQGEWKSRTARSLGETALQITSKKNETASQTLSLRDVLGDNDQNPPKGIYHVSVDATDEAWVRDSAVVTITDLALTVKQTSDEMLVWVTSLKTGQPVSDALVSTISFNNQTLTSATSDASGIARLAIDSKHPDGQPWLVIAQAHEQTTWHNCDQGHWVLDEVDQSGRTLRALDVMLFTDRGTYRPGETIQISGIVRDDQGRSVPSFPIDLSVIRPDGRTVETLKVTPKPDAEGTFNIAFTTPENSWTGPWRFRATLIDDDEAIGTTHAYVEKFVPVRIDLKSVPSSELFVSKELATLDVNARYLFGPPASGLQVRVEGDFRATRFRSQEMPQFHFGPRHISEHHLLDTITTNLSADGIAQIVIPDPESLGIQRFKATTVATVTEDGGRSVSRMATFVRDNSPFHIGLKVRTDGVVTAQKESEFEWCLRTPDDKEAKFQPLRFELARVDYDNVLRRVNNRTIWETVERVESIEQISVDNKELSPKSGAPSVIAFTCPKTGTYRLIAVAKTGNVITEIEFFASDQGANSASLALREPEQIELKLDRELYVPGGKGTLFINTPFAGQMWVTLESDRVHWSRIVDVEKKSSQVEIEIPQGIRGGGFITASIIRPVNPADRQWLPHRARGIVRVETDHSDARIPATIVAPSRVEPGTEIEVTATSIPGAIIQVWAVDEGILATSGFRTPNPHGHFFARRANRVTSSDVFGRLLPDHRRPDGMSRIGGGGDAVDPLRRNPVPSRMRKPAIVWSTFQRADAQGRVLIKATVPDFTGELRWMAIAIKGDQYGHSSKATTVTSDFLVEASWPRFAAPGDRFEVPVRLINTTDLDIKATVATSVTGPLNLTVADSDVFVAGNSSRVIRMSATTNAIGSAEGKLIVTSSANEASSGAAIKTTVREFSLPVRAANPLVTDRMFVSLEAGDVFPIDLGKNKDSGTHKVELMFSSNPNVDLQPAVDHLMHYPYGCVEQTTSRLRGLLAAGNLVETKAGQGNRAEAIRSMATAGISRLWAMQLKSGALSYWPGQNSPHEWGTIYAVLTLLEAQDRGIKVDERFLDSLRKYLAVALHHSTERDANVTALMCLALARLDSPPIGWMSRLTERIADLDMGGRASLALAWFAAGRKDRALDALPEDTIDLPTQASYASRFTSETAQRAQLARALQRISPEHAWLPQLIGQIKKAKENGVWLSTLENALVIEVLTANHALGKSKPFTGQLTVGTEVFDFKPGSTKKLDISDRQGNIGIKTAGEGTVSLLFKTTSLSDTPAEDHDRLIKVRRRWLDRKGKSINRESIRVGDLVVVEVTLEAIGRKPIESIAIVDPLPTGFEVENPRLQTSDQSNATNVSSHTEFLDDRVILFTEAPASPRTYQYSIRAVTAGDFVVPPIQATCMYNESIESVFGSSRVKVDRTPSNPNPLPLATKPKTNSTRK